MDFEPMSPEQIERTVHFMLDQQAQVEANLASVSANLASLSKKTDGMADAIVALTALSDRTERTVREVTAGHAALREALIALTGIVGRSSERVDTRLDEMAETGTRIDQRLDRLAESQERTDQQIKELGTYFPRPPRKERRRRPS